MSECYYPWKSDKTKERFTDPNATLEQDGKIKYLHFYEDLLEEFNDDRELTMKTMRALLGINGLNAQTDKELRG